MKEPERHTTENIFSIRQPKYLSEGAMILIKKIQVQIDLLRFSELKMELEESDPEIDQDKEKVIEIIKHYNFNKDMIKYLSEIDQAIHDSNNNIINSGIINTFREFTKKLSENIAKKIQSLEGDEFPQ
ncbi:MAG: hypothetical protein AABX82_08165, partial [Nanoarchaeota archaeon]